MNERVSHEENKEYSIRIYAFRFNLRPGNSMRGMHPRSFALSEASSLACKHPTLRKDKSAQTLSIWFQTVTNLRLQDIYLLRIERPTTN